MLPGGKEERPHVVQEREVAEQDARDARTFVVLAGQGDTGRGRDRPVDARESAVGVDGHLLAPEQFVGDPDETRRPEHEPVVGPGRAPQGVDEGGTVDGSADHRDLGVDRAESLVRNGGRQPVRVGSGRAQIDGRRARRAHPLPQPRAVPGAVGIHGVRRPGRPVEVDGLARAAHRDHLDVLASEQARDLAAQGGVPEHDDPLDAATERRVAQERGVGVHDVSAVPRAADDLGDEREAAAVGELLGRGARIGAGDHDRARPRSEDHRFLGLGCHIRDPDPATALVQSSGCLVGGRIAGRRGSRRTVHEPHRGGTRERFAQGDVEMNGTGRAHALAQRRGERRRGDRVERGGLGGGGIRVHGVGDGEVGLEPGRRMEEPGLPRGLVRPDAAQLRGTVGGEEQQRNAGVVGLQGGGQQVRDRRARRADHGGGHPGLAPDAEGREPRDAFVDAHVQAHESRALQVGRHEGQGLRPRPGAHDQVPHAASDEPGQQRRSRVRRGRCGARLPLCHGQPTAPR